MLHKDLVAPMAMLPRGARRAAALGGTALLLTLAAACGKAKADSGKKAATTSPPATEASAGADTAAAPGANALNASGPVASLPPNEMGKIPVLEYHLIQDHVFDEFERPPARFRQDLEELYQHGYWPVTMKDVLDKSIQELPKGKSPVVFTFDDASPEQFRWIEENGKLVVDPTSALGIWMDFQKKHPDWPNKAVFCMLPAAGAGHAFFGGKNFEGQKPEWRFMKVKYLEDHGFELCNHTLWHARLDKYPDAFVQEQIARGQLAIDSVTGGEYRVQTFALPLGMWPKNKSLAWHGSWTDPKTHKTLTYNYDVVLEVSGNPNVNPYDSSWDPHHTNRQIMSGNAMEALLKRLDKPGPASRYVSDGDPKTVAKPPAAVAE